MMGSSRSRTCALGHNPGILRSRCRRAINIITIDKGGKGSGLMTSANTSHSPLMDRAYPFLPNINRDLDVAKNPFDAWEVIVFVQTTDRQLT